MMSRLMDNLRLAIKRAPTTLHDAVFAIMCKLLLPLSTDCRVCNMLRGMALGILVGIGFTCLAVAPFIHHWWGC